MTIIDDIDDRPRSLTTLTTLTIIDDIDKRQQSTTTMTIKTMTTMITMMIFWSDGTEKWLDRRGSDGKFVELYDDNEDNNYVNNNYDNHNEDNNEND